jgi:hypothetical protein
MLGLPRFGFVPRVEKHPRPVSCDDDAMSEPLAGLVVEVMCAQALAEPEAVGLVFEVDLHAPFVVVHGTG